jgi:CRISPR-associated endonuclease/helicase Cas3
MIDLVFPITGSTLPIDHSYPLYGALSGIVPAIHRQEASMRFAPVKGIADTEGLLHIGTHSHLRIRLPDHSIRLALPLAGKRLDINGHAIRLGVPAVRTLEPASSLIARIVTFKNAETPDAFLATARTKLVELGVAGEPQLPIHLEGSRAGEPKRRVLRIGDTTIVGYAMLVSELTAADSLMLQERGLGGRTNIGCGFFVPAKGM